MSVFRSLKRLVTACLTLLFILSILLTACSSPSSLTPPTVPTTMSKSVSTPSTSTIAQSDKPVATTQEVPRSVLGCPQGDPAPGLTPLYGGTLKIIYNLSPSNIGAPWLRVAAQDSTYARFAVENLIGLDSKGNPIPQLATGWDTDIINNILTLTLRQGVKFHDGTDFDATAAKWCLDMYRKGVNGSVLAKVTSIDVIDDYHLRLTLSEWEPLILNYLSVSNAGKMVSPTAAQKLGDAIMLNPVGTGPFKFGSFQPNVSCKYQRFEDYWQKGLPYLDGVEINMVSDAVVALTSFTKGEAQLLGTATTTDAISLKKQGFKIFSNPIFIGGIAGDSKNAASPSADIRVRRAIAYAIDNDTIINSVYDGLCIPTHQLAIPGMTAYNPQVIGYPYDPGKARQLLAEAGYSTLKTKLVYQADVQKADLYAAVQDQLSKVGIDISLEPLAAAAFTKLYSAGWNNHLIDYNMSYNGFSVKYNVGLSWGLSATMTRFVSVWTPGYDYETQINLMQKENDPEKREEYYRLVNKMAVDDYCLVVPIWGGQRFSAQAPNLIDCGFGVIATVEFLPERAWLSK